jgi:hypothetical protein
MFKIALTTRDLEVFLCLALPNKSHTLYRLSSNVSLEQSNGLSDRWELTPGLSRSYLIENVLFREIRVRWLQSRKTH